jgi:DNA-binding transcriptional regulator YiaG
LSSAMDIVMISLKTCQEILRKNGKKYSEAEIKIIREQLTQLSQIEYEHYRKIQRDKESSDLYASIDRGASNSWV